MFGSVESVKAVSDLFAPLSGKVLKVNSPLSDSPEYVNEEPYDGGWMIQIELVQPRGDQEADGRQGLRRVRQRAGVTRPAAVPVETARTR